MSKCIVCGDTLTPAGFGTGQGKTYRLSMLQDPTDPTNDYENGQWDLICEQCESEAARRFLITGGFKINPNRKLMIRKWKQEQDKYEGTIGDIRKRKAKESK